MLPVNGAPVPMDESVAVTVKLNVPAAVGEPDNTPPPDKDNPLGNDPAVIA